MKKNQRSLLLNHLYTYGKINTTNHHHDQAMIKTQYKILIMFTKQHKPVHES